MDSIFSPLFDEKTKEFFKKNEKVLEFLKKKLSPKIYEKAKEIEEKGFQLNKDTYLESGDIIYRPLSFLKTDLSMEMNHYGIVFGKMLNNEYLVLENSSGTNVSFKTLVAFLDTHPISNLKIERKPKDTTFDLILSRASEVEHDQYSKTYFNCRHFVNYCVYGEKISEQVEMIKTIVSPVMKIITAYLKGTSNSYLYQRDRDIILNVANKIELVTGKIDELK